MGREHFTIEKRIMIEQMLNNKRTFTEIAFNVGKHQSTVSREIKAHIVTRRTGGRGFCYNNCANRFFCKRTHICFPCKAERKQSLCRRCKMCNFNCKDYVPAECPKLKKPPYVCNGCGLVYECSLEKHFYFASEANSFYLTLLSESRSGISFSEEELTAIDKKVSPLIRQGQSPHHVCVANYDTLMVSERTIYRLIEASMISAKNIDLQRKVKFRPRKKKKVFKVDKTCRIGRTFQCFQSYMTEHPGLPVTQLDSVEGKKGGKVLLTIHFQNCEMMLALLRDENTAKSVNDIFQFFYDRLGDAEFKHTFQILLADNGSEFSNPKGIEFTADARRRTRLFYCDPNAPYEKGSCERNHEFIRLFIPKGKPLDSYTQEDITLMMNHINSYARPSLGNKCPYDVFRFFYGDKLLDLLGCVTIPPNQIVLSPSIFKKEGAKCDI